MRYCLKLVQYVWLWVAIETTDRETIGISISKERNMFVTERFLSNLVLKYGQYTVSTNGSTWYLQACRFLKIKKVSHSFSF